MVTTPGARAAYRRAASSVLAAFVRAAAGSGGRPRAAGPLTTTASVRSRALQPVARSTSAPTTPPPRAATRTASAIVLAGTPATVPASGGASCEPGSLAVLATGTCCPPRATSSGFDDFPREMRAAGVFGDGGRPPGPGEREGPRGNG